MRSPVEPTPTIRVDGRLRGSETRFALAGPYVLSLSTALGELAVQLHSTYVGHADAETQIAELLIEPESGATTSSRVAPAGELPVSFARGLCLYDHLHSLRDKLEALGFGDVAIDVPEPAVASIESYEPTRRFAGDARLARARSASYEHTRTDPLSRNIGDGCPRCRSVPSTTSRSDAPSAPPG